VIVSSPRAGCAWQGALAIMLPMPVCCAFSVRRSPLFSYSMCANPVIGDW
jgi:hypothetical protein